jgi:hypothetical protein
MQVIGAAAEELPMTTWKRVVLIAAGFGAGFVVCAAVIAGTFYWYSTRPQPWNNTALKASFETMGLSTNPQQANYSVDFVYTIENTTRRNYEFQPSNVTIFANLAEEFSSASQKNPSLSKDFGDYQKEDPTIDGPSFIPPQNRARFHIRVSYQYPNDFSEADKADINKVIKQVGKRLKELKGIVLFDQSNHYRIDLPKGWEDVENQTELKK